MMDCKPGKLWQNGRRLLPAGASCVKQKNLTGRFLKVRVEPGTLTATERHGFNIPARYIVSILRLPICNSPPAKNLDQDPPTLPPGKAAAPRLPWLIGLRAARANFWPGLCVQASMAVLVLAYYQAHWSRPWFDALAHAKQRGGYVFSIAAAMVAGGVLPELLQIVFLDRGRSARRVARDLVFTMTFWGFTGFTVDLLYRLQTLWFGSGLGWSTVVLKVLVDQFIYTSIYAVPAVTWAYEWRDRGFRLHGLGDLFTPAFCASRIFPTLLANWGVWIPLVTLIYLLPPLLQTPLFSLALTFWVLIVTYITSVHQPRPG